MPSLKGIFLSVLLSISGFAQVPDIASLVGWQDNYVQAQKIAMEKQKPLLVAFLGPNWCPFSDQLEAEVLSNPQFLQALKDEVVFVKIDIPEDFQEQNFAGKELKELFQVEECPALVLVDPNGKKIAKLNYLPLQSEEYVRYVKQVFSDFERISQLEKQEIRHLKIDELQHLYVRAGRLADTTFKTALLKQGLKVDRGPYFLLEQYGNKLMKGRYNDGRIRKLREKILARDPENELGCRRRIALLDFEALSHGNQKGKSDTVIRPIVDYLQKFGREDRENAWRLEMKISQYLFSQNQIEEALKHAKASYQVAPDAEQKEINQSIEYLQARLTPDCDLIHGLK